MKVVPFAGCLLFAFVSILTVDAAVSGKIADGAYELTVPDGEEHTLTDADVVALSGFDLVKLGGGRLVIDRSLKGYKGEMRVKEGYLLALHKEAFGDVDKGTTVSSGATLEFKDDSENGVLKFGKEQLTVSGIGVAGCGALRHVGTEKDQWCAVFERVKLAGDTRFGAVSYGSESSKKYRRWDIRGGQGVFDMQGYNLEVVCSFGMLGVDVVNPGNITVKGLNSTFILEGDTPRLNGSAANTLTMEEGTTLQSQKFKSPIKWSVVLDGCTCNELYASGDYVNRGRFDGPVTITEKGVQFTRGGSSNGAHWSFGGTVTANGAIKGGNPIELIVIKGEDDSIADKVRLYRHMRSKVEPSHLDEKVRVRLHMASGTEDEPLALSSEESADLIATRIDLAGATAVSLSGSQNDVVYRQAGGYVRIGEPSAVHSFKDLVVAGDAVLDFSNAGRVDIHTNALNVGGKYPAVARMRLENTLLMTNWTGRASGGSTNIHVGPVRKMAGDGYAISDFFGGRGILEICDGSVVSNIFNVGYVPVSQNLKNSYCHGSLFVRGGTVVMVGAAGEYVYNRIGSSGSGFVEVSGGTVKAMNYIYPASGEYGRGIWYQKGGTTLIDKSTPGFIWGQFSRSANPSKGIYWQTGGFVKCDKPLVFGKTLYDSNNSGNRDCFTMSGGEMFVNHATDLAGAPDAKTIVNLNGGTFRTMFMQILTNENQTIIGTGEDKTLDGTYAWINFAGGCFSYVHRTDALTERKAYKAQSFFYGDPDRMRITSYVGGAVLDTAGYDRNLDHTITAPSGNGLVSLSLPAGVKISDWMFAGAPFVEISGDGSGASAVAEFDSVNGRVTGFVVTSPGNDYTEISAKISHGGYTNVIPLACTLGTAASGGLTKKGEGVLRMNAANTYAGVTRVEGGTLKAVHADAIPAGNGLEISGGTLDAGGFEKAYGTISATSGTLRNASGSFSSFVKKGEGSFMFDAPLSSSATLEVREGTLKLPVSVPGLVCGERIYGQAESSVEYDKGLPLSGLGTDLAPALAYKTGSDGYYQPRHYVSYSGYAWNRSDTNETWTFAYSFDDSLRIWINGEKLTAENQGGTGWGVLNLAKVTLKPGANSFLIQLWNGPDAGGAVAHGLVQGCINWTKDHTGIVYNPNGGDSTNGLDYVRMADPGDGSLFTVYPYDGSTIPSYDSIKMWPGTTLDVCGGMYPFGKVLKVSEDVLENPIRVAGGIVFASGAVVDIENLEMFDRAQGGRTLIATTHGISGALPDLDGAWRLRVSADGKNLELAPRRGTAITFR